MKDHEHIDTIAGILIGTILGASLYGCAIALVLVFA